MTDDEIRAALARAWAEGVQWGAVEACGFERTPIELTPGENPYEETP